MRETCKICGEPRGASSWASYCKVCGNKRQRDKFRKEREALGMVVRPRAGTDREREDAMFRAHNKVGPCEGCRARDTLKLLVKGVRFDDKIGAWDIEKSVPVMLLCEECLPIVAVLLSNPRIDEDIVRRIYLRTKPVALSPEDAIVHPFNPLL